MKKLSTLFLSTLSIFGTTLISLANSQRSSPFPNQPTNDDTDTDLAHCDVDESTMDTLPDAEQLLELREKDRTCSGNQPLDNADQRSAARDAQEYLVRHFSGQPHTD